MAEKHRLTENTKLTIQLIMAVVLVVVGVTLFFMGFYAIPLGEISASVLTAGGEIFAFSGSLMGLDYNFKYKSEKLREEYRHKYRNHPPYMDYDDAPEIDDNEKGED